VAFFDSQCILYKLLTAAATADDVREETSLTRKGTPHRYDSDEEAFN